MNVGFLFGEDFPTRDGAGVRDYIHVSDLVSVHRTALTRMRQEPGFAVFNFGYGTGYFVREVVSAASGCLASTSKSLGKAGCQEIPVR